MAPSLNTGAPASPFRHRTVRAGLLIGLVLFALAAGVAVALRAGPPQGPGTALPPDGGARALEDLLAAGERAERRGDATGMDRCYREAIERFPDSARAWLYYGEYQRFFALDVALAREAFVRAEERAGEDCTTRAFALRGLGEVARHEGHAGEALELFRRSLVVQPLPDTHRSLAHLLGTQSDFSAAADHAQKAADMDPDDPIAALLCAAHLARAGRAEQARRIAAGVLQQAGVNPDGTHDGPVHCCILYNAAGYYAVAGQPDRALAMLGAFFRTPNHRHLERTDVLGDPDFASLGARPDFQALVDAHLAPH